MKTFFQKINLKSGFTMVEMLAALSVFMIVISIASGTFIKSLRTQRATVNFIAANSNAGLAMEQISREIRTGSNFSSGGNQINFVNSRAENVIYRWNSTDESLERSADGINFKRLTADNVRVKNVFFNVFTGSPSDQYPPRITIVLQVGGLGELLSGSVVNLQTTVSARLLQ